MANVPYVLIKKEYEEDIEDDKAVAMEMGKLLIGWLWSAGSWGVG